MALSLAQSVAGQPARPPAHSPILSLPLSLPITEETGLSLNMHCTGLENKKTMEREGDGEQREVRIIVTIL